MIGNFDDTGLMLLAAPITYKNAGGSNPSAFNSGKMSALYRGAAAGGTEYLTLTNMGSGYGYTTDGVIKHDAANDACVFSNLTIPVTNDSSFSYFTSIYIDAFAAVGYSYLLTSNSTGKIFSFDITATSKIRFLFYDGATQQTQSSTTVSLLDGWHTLGCVKNGTGMKIYMDGVDISDGAITYSLGNISYNANFWILGRQDDPAQGVPNAWWRWAALYANARSSGNITADHANAATFYGLIGVNDAPGTDEVFDSLTAPASGTVIPVIMNQYRQRRR